ncbi:hypothetical protein pb186bvf_010702 [Paramecium bursaria]
MITRFVTKQMFKNLRPTFGINHIKNMWEESLREESQKLNDQSQLVVPYNRVYKPFKTIEFDREGQVLLYSCDPFRHVEVYFKYPYVMYETMMPLGVYMWFVNPFDLVWTLNNIFVYSILVLWIPRMWYFRDLQYKVHRLYLLRGGKVAKIEINTLNNDRGTYWVETYQFHPLTQDRKYFDDRDNADYLEEEGQLKYELACQLDHVQEYGTTVQDEVFYFMPQGVVHHPELFEAVTKGYTVDTSDFVINTAHNIRTYEGTPNQ